MSLEKIDSAIYNLQMQKNNPERDPYEGYKDLLKRIYSNDWKFRHQPDLYEQAQEQVTRLLTNATVIPYLVDEVDLALNKALDPRHRFVLQHHYGLSQSLGEPKTDSMVGEIAPRADGGTGLSKSRVRVMRILGHHYLFRYQRENPIAGLSFNP